MSAPDTTFCLDFLRGNPRARERAAAWATDQERLTIPAPALADFLRSGYRQGGRLQDWNLALIRRREVLPLDAETADEDARMGVELDRKGPAVANLDVLITALVRKLRAVLVS